MIILCKLEQRGRGPHWRKAGVYNWGKGQWQKTRGCQKSKETPNMSKGHQKNSSRKEAEKGKTVSHSSRRVSLIMQQGIVCKLNTDYNV